MPRLAGVPSPFVPLTIPRPAVPRPCWAASLSAQRSCSEVLQPGSGFRGRSRGQGELLLFPLPRPVTCRLCIYSIARGHREPAVRTRESGTSLTPWLPRSPGDPGTNSGRTAHGHPRSQPRNRCPQSAWTVTVPPAPGALRPGRRPGLTRVASASHATCPASGTLTSQVPTRQSDLQRFLFAPVKYTKPNAFPQSVRPSNIQTTHPRDAQGRRLKILRSPLSNLQVKGEKQTKAEESPRAARPSTPMAPVGPLASTCSSSRTVTPPNTEGRSPTP